MCVSVNGKEIVVHELNPFFNELMPSISRKTEQLTWVRYLCHLKKKAHREVKSRNVSL